MTLTEGLLIVIVIVLTILVLTNSRKTNVESNSKTWDCVDRGTGETTQVKMQYTSAEKNPERTSLKENAEFFTAQSSEVLNYQCGDEDKFVFANNEFGAPGMSYKDYVANQAVDPAVIKNHSEFVKDRFTDNKQNVTGRTRSLGEIESSDAVPYVGLRRPQHVPDSAKAGALQVSDARDSGYTNKPTFTWTSS